MDQQSCALSLEEGWRAATHWHMHSICAAVWPTSPCSPCWKQKLNRTLIGTLPSRMPFLIPQPTAVTQNKCSKNHTMSFMYILTGGDVKEFVPQRSPPNFYLAQKCNITAGSTQTWAQMRHSWCGLSSLFSQPSQTTSQAQLKQLLAKSGE